MTNYLEDLSRFGYGMGGAPMLGTPGIVGMDVPNMGAGPGRGSDPTSAYFQRRQTQPSAADNWGGMRNISARAPTTGGGGNQSNNSGFGFNMDTGKMVLGGLESIGNLWMAWEANKLAKKQFDVSRGFANANLENQTQAYNTTLEDRARSRYFAQNMSDADAQAYIDANKLAKRKI